MHQLFSFFFLVLSVQALSQGIGPEDKVISIFFGGGSYWIDAEQIDKLNEFVFSIEKLNEYDVEVHGHTDNIGSFEYNQYLSEMRSQAVINRLEELEIVWDQIKKFDFGENSPVYDNSTWGGKLSNRRVDVVFRKIML